MTPGMRTSEFYVTVATNIGVVAAALAGALSPRYAAVASAVSVAAYSVARGLAKQNTPAS
jgi:hypothetical protein